jgi:hypothetical protein
MSNIQIDHKLLAEALHAHDVRNCPEPKPVLKDRVQFVQDYYAGLAEVTIKHIAEFNPTDSIERL